MKFLRYSYFVVLTAVLTVSCDKYLDVIPDGVATIDDAFRSRTTTEKYLFTCYSYMPSHGAHDANTFFAGDEIWAPFPQVTVNFNSATFEQLARGNQSIITPRLNYWDGNNGGKPLFRGIRDCNIFLENIESVVGIQEIERRQWTAEVKFLKAYYHFWLMRMYGPIPLVKENLPISASVEEVQVKRDPLDDCFAYVVSLLDEAIPDLPLNVANENDELGRITKPIAATVKAQILVEAASPLFNGNLDYANFRDHDGVALFNTDYDQNKWILAATACKEAIDFAHAANVRLYQFNRATVPAVISDTTALQMTIRNSVTERWNREIIWGNTNSGATYMQWLSMARIDPERLGSPVGSILAPPLHIAEMFYTDKGVPIDEDITWDYGDRYQVRQATEDERYNIEENYNTASLHFNRENRFYASMAFDGSVWYGQRKFDDDDTFVVKSKIGQYSAKTGASLHSVTGYFVKKLVHFQSVINPGNVGMTYVDYPWPVIRLADLYLLYAEVLNEVNSAPTVEAYEYVNLVRERAGLPDVQDAWTNYSRNPQKYTTKDGFRKIVQQERLIELAFEGHRYWDIRRWKRGTEMFNRNIRGWDIDQETAPLYNRVRTIYTQRFSTRDYLWPISESTLIRNKKLVQNPGW